MNPDENANGLTEESAVGDWIVTFADLMTLLLVFFVLLFSMSSLDVEKFKRALRSIRTSLGDTETSYQYSGGDDIPDSNEKKSIIENLTGDRSTEQLILKSVNEAIGDLNENKNVMVYSKAGKVIIQMQGNLLFQSATATLNKRAIPFLDEVIDIIQRYPQFEVAIKGHTDDIPIETEKFPSNWELSAVRSTSILRHLISNGVDPLRLTATGYADMFPLVSNDTPENRATNRRVEFVLEKRKEKRQ